MTFRHCVAVDLGASSGRVMLASYHREQRTLQLREIHRFVNCLQKQDGFDCWDIFPVNPFSLNQDCLRYLSFQY